MGVTILAVLSAALLLPGIIAAKFFYRAGTTAEVDSVLPSLSTADGLVQLGSFSVLVHTVYASALLLVARLPDWTGLPLANPYVLFATTRPAAPIVALAWATFAGMVLLSVLAAVCGSIAGTLFFRRGGQAIFYGPLTELIAQSHGDNRVITAYVLSKVMHDGRLLGYQGTVRSLVRDADRLPGRVLLSDAFVFSLTISSHGAVRRESERRIAWIALSAADWHNIAFRVFELIDDPPFAQDRDHQ